jgi:hypothetical protein
MLARTNQRLQNKAKGREGFLRGEIEMGWFFFWALLALSERAVRCGSTEKASSVTRQMLTFPLVFFLHARSSVSNGDFGKRPSSKQIEKMEREGDSLHRAIATIWQRL